jgi:hypothetical protein
MGGKNVELEMEYPKIYVSVEYVPSLNSKMSIEQRCDINNL